MSLPNPTRSEREPRERYEPLPGVAALPRWLWQRAGRRGRIAGAAALLVAIALLAALAQSSRESAQERAAAERRERAELRERLIRELRAEQRPRFRRSRSVAPAAASPRPRLEARSGLIGELSATILADARRRVRLGALEGPIRDVDCEPFPRTVSGVGAHEDLARRRGRYYCIAATSRFRRSEASVGGVLGYPYRAMVDFESGRYAFCKISGRPDPTPDPRVTTPRVCGG